MGLFSAYLLRRRLRMVVPWLGRSILDIGCGSAALVERLSSGQSYTGVELRSEAIEVLQQRFPGHCFLRCDVDHSPLPDFSRKFDTVVMAAVIEHLEQPEKVMAACHCLLLSGGRVVLTTPSPAGMRVHRLAAALGLASREASREHKQCHGRAALDQLARSAGFVVVCYRRFLLGLNQLVVCERASAPVAATGHSVGGRELHEAQ